jgi:N utilization substance protein A
MDISAETKRAVSALFSDHVESEEEITKIGELPGISERIVGILSEHGIELIDALLAMDAEELGAIEGLTAPDIKSINSIISENVEIVEQEYEAEKPEAEPEEEPVGLEEEEPEETEEDEYECPECGASITLDMTSCPNCGVGLSFEIEEEEAGEAADASAGAGEEEE